jgi:hypothetical protein
MPGCAPIFSWANRLFLNPRVALAYRVFLYNAALLQKGIQRGLDVLQPQHAVCYAGTLAAYRVFLETCRQRGIPVLVHERGPLDDTFIFADSDYYGRMAGREESLKAWESVPLSDEEYQAAKWHILERELGKNLNRDHFYRMPPVKGSLRYALRIPYDASIIAVFTQSDWELGMARGYVDRLFDQAIDGVKQILDNLIANNSADIYWVFRLHPNMIGPTWTDFVFLEQMIAQGLLMPHNVRVIMPTERITSYQLIWEADAALSFGTLFGAEALVRGLSVACSVDNLTVKINGVEKIHSIEDYSNALSRVMQKTKQLSLEDMRSAYRRFYYYFFRLSYRFKSFGIREFYQPELRFTSLEELKEGKDEKLDVLCNHIMNSQPLYPFPNQAEQERSDEEETQFLMQVIEDIKTRRAEAKEQDFLMKDVKEPLISTVCMLRDRSSQTVEEVENTRFQRSLQRSRHKTIEVQTLRLSATVTAQQFLQQLIETAKNAHGEYIYVGAAEVQLDEALFSTAIDYLEEEEHKLLSAVMTGAWILTAEGHFSGDIFTLRKEPRDYVEAQQWLPLLRDPLYLLSCFVWRREAFIDLFSSLQVSTTLLSGISSALFADITEKAAKGLMDKLKVPFITFYLPGT